MIIFFLKVKIEIFDVLFLIIINDGIWQQINPVNNVIFLTLYQ